MAEAVRHRRESTDIPPRLARPDRTRGSAGYPNHCKFADDFGRPGGLPAVPVGVRFGQQTAREGKPAWISRS